MDAIRKMEKHLSRTLLPRLNFNSLSKGNLNLSLAGNFNRLTHATSESEIVKADRTINTGTNRIPKVVKFKIKPSKGVTERLNMKLKATLSISSKSSLFGNSIALNEYPGRKRTKTRPMKILNIKVLNSHWQNHNYRFENIFALQV